MKKKDIYTEAWNITWKYKSLWVFGFVAGITLNPKSGSTDSFSGGAWLFENLDTVFSSNTSISTLLTTGVAIVLWLVGLVARADLIHGSAGIANITKANQLSFKALLPLGFGSLPKLVGMQLIVWLPFTILAMLTAFQVPLMGRYESTSFFLDFAGIGTTVIISFVLFLGLSFIDAFAFRLILLDSQSIVGSIQRAGQIVWQNWRKILKTTIICGIIGLIFAAIIGIPLAPLLGFLMAPLTGPLQEAMTQCTANNTEIEAISECIQGIQMRSITLAVLLPASLIIAAFYSVWATFLSTVFTLLYGDIVAVTTGHRKRGRVKTA